VASHEANHLTGLGMFKVWTQQLTSWWEVVVYMGTTASLHTGPHSSAEV